MREAFSKKYWPIWEINFWKFNETLANDVVSFEQLGPDVVFCFPLAEWVISKEEGWKNGV